jgi:DNA-binding NarL/FixJ family response regulator
MARSDVFSPITADLPKPVSVFLICRVRLYRDAIVGMLNRQAGIKVVGFTEGGENIAPDLETTTPDVVLLDTGAPGAFSLATRLMRDRPQTRVLGFGVDDVKSEVVACAEAGLSGYVPSDASIGDLAKAARRIASGDTVCSAVMADQLFDHIRSTALSGTPPLIERVLTGRQQQVLGLIDQGLSNKQIARRLFLGTSTVKNHVHNILSRLQVARRSEAVAVGRKIAVP